MAVDFAASGAGVTAGSGNDGVSKGDVASAGESVTEGVGVGVAAGAQISATLRSGGDTVPSPHTQASTAPATMDQLSAPRAE